MVFSSQQIKEWAYELGFSHCGIARARRLNEAQSLFENALSEGRHADMHFLERDMNKRFCPSDLLPNCQSVIVVAYNYLVDEQPASDKYRTARYTWIEDYHTLLKGMLEEMVLKISTIGECRCRITVDSSCISEKNWAVEAGIGCYGKNGLIHNEDGSFFVLGTILADFGCDQYDSARESDCGNCRICVEKCPAGALESPYRVDARKCFSYHTVENKMSENKLLEKAPLIYGCDVCQEVCPKNHKKEKASSDQPKTSLFLRLQNEQLENLSKEDFKHYFGNTAIARRKYNRFLHAIQIRKNETQ